MLSWIVDITQYLWLVWLVIVITAVVVELLTLEFTFLMVAAGSLLGGLGTNLLGLPWWAQVGSAAVVTALLLLLIRPVLLRTVGKNDELVPTNVDALAGMPGVVVGEARQDAVSGAPASVKLRNGETWSALAEQDSYSLTVGQAVSVVRVEGAYVVVAPAVTVGDAEEGES
jgi:membrane protein implicated in regulation of membrane protease activity